MMKLNLERQSPGTPNNSPDGQGAVNSLTSPEQSTEGKQRDDGWVVILLLSLYLIGVLAAATLAILYMSLGYLREPYAGIRIGLMCAA